VASLRHPAVARCLGRFDAYGTCFMVMEYLDGPELGELVRCAHPLPEGEVRKILGALAQSLAHVHAAGIVHGDLKPANVMLTRTGLVKLTDFGIATAVNEIESKRGTLLGGTPLYMAPELFDRGRPSPAADVYALGCVLWELLQGERLFQEKELEDLVWKKEAFVLPARQAVRPDLAPDLYAVLERSLHHDPRRRTLDLPALGAMAGRVDAALVQRVLERSSSASG
jgi:serine/threonine protein kinase